MNGVDRPGVNIYGSSGHPYAYHPIFYSYPDDLGLIREMIDWILAENQVAAGDLPAKASRIFPITGHRFLLIDDPKHRVLPMYGNDIIYWANSLGGLLQVEIFPATLRPVRHEQRPDLPADEIRFWLDD